ncbi:MAG: redoxin family protein [Rickettsiales bacterium]|nr:redoxin family protein [Rickettsiales bacterium]
MVFLILCIILTALLYLRPLEEPALELGGEFPDISLPYYIENTPVTSEFKIYNFFASWCSPCIAEIPYLDLIAKVSGQPVLGIAWDKNLTKLEKFLEDHGNPYRSIQLDSRGKLAAALGVNGLPETIVVDQNNEIIWRLRGPITRKEYDDLKRTLMSP